MAINIFVENDTLFLDYSPDFESNWVFGEFEISNKVIIKKVFEFEKDDLYENELGYATSENSSIFVLGILDCKKKYFVIAGRKLGIPYDIYFDRNVNIISDYFIGIREVSIFKNISKVITSNLIIGLDEDADINIKTFTKLIRNFPNSYELKKYVEKRIYGIIKDEFDKTKDAERMYEDYMNKKYSKKDIILEDTFLLSEKSKYEYLYTKLSEMLKNQELYNESVWQKNIFDILKIVFPKYVHILREAPVRDYYNRLV